MKLTDRFYRYVQIDTQSDPNSSEVPSTSKQSRLARLLYAELVQMGASSVIYDKEDCIVYAKLPATPGCEKVPSIGFIAHMDTSDAVSGANVNPRKIVYEGSDISLDSNGKYVLSEKEFPDLAKQMGKEIIVTDGMTLLGADDKAGIAEIMDMAEFFLKNKDEKHGNICLAFTSDEEIGNGADKFDLDTFGADFGYTIDGGDVGGIEFENFNASEADITITGRSTHPGSAKGKMISAIIVGMELQSMLPLNEDPMHTDGYEGFYHLMDISGDVEKTVMKYIIRDHDEDKFKKREENIRNIADKLNKEYGEGTVCIDIKEEYRNMADIIRKNYHLVENAAKAMVCLGIEPAIKPIRGGTDGAMLSFEGLPCPNLGTGGYNYHSRYEYASVDEMKNSSDIIKQICRIYAEK